MSVPEISQQNMVFCVDIGGTRAKFGLLPRKITNLSQLQAVVTKECEGGYELRKKVPAIFKESEGPFAPFLKQTRAISLSLLGPFDGSGNYLDDNNSLGYPRNFKGLCSQVTGCEVAVNNDAISFAKGAYKYQKLKKEPIAFPCLVLTLGTGVGVALIKGKKSYVSVELARGGWTFTQLEKTVKEQEGEQKKAQIPNSSVHSLLGRHFVAWIDATAPEKKASYYQARVQALSRDLSAVLKVQIASVVVGGGNSRFIKASDAFTGKAIILNPSSLQQDQVSQDIIPLLGCLQNLTKFSSQSKI